MIRILQFFNEHGISLPIYSKSEKCAFFWKSKDNNSEVGNRPQDYASKDMRIVDIMASFWDKQKISSVIELGSNCGGNLNRLSQLGYDDLFGVEINRTAIYEMGKSFPSLNAGIYEGSLENVLIHLPSNYCDMVFSMAVLLHIHPKSNFVFKEIVRVSNRYICTVEEENQYCNYVFPRNYKRVFENLGCKEIFSINLNKYNIINYKEYVLRIFEKC